MHMKSEFEKTLIILTNGFPLSSSEVFLHKEIEFLKSISVLLLFLAIQKKIKPKKKL